MIQIKKDMQKKYEKKEIKDLTLDELLDKINKSGMDSLTENEIKFLNNYNN